MIPPIPGIVPGKNHMFINKHRVYELYDCDIYASVAALPRSKVVLDIADASVIKVGPAVYMRSRLVTVVTGYHVFKIAFS